MKAVRLTRANGVNERIRGDAHTVLIVEDADADEAVRQELAVYAPEYDPGVPAQEIPIVKKEPAIDPADVLDYIEAAEARLNELEKVLTDPAEPEMKRPYGNASKAAWIDWAVHSGCDAEEAAGLTKTELMSRYGERL